MRILLFGIKNMGKTSIGEVLAQKLQYDFYDLDEEIKKKYKMTLENFINTYPDDYERNQKRCDFVHELIDKSANSVIAVSILNYKDQVDQLLKHEDILPIELRDTPQNIFDRLVFSDENDNVYKDDEYKNLHKDHYIYEIISDLYYYSHIYEDIKSKYFINDQSIEEAANNLYTLITNHQTISIKFNLDEIVSDIIESWIEKVCYYNIITHEKIYRNKVKPIYEVEDELFYNHEIYVQLPTYDDYNEYQIFKDFINTIDDTSKKDKLMKAYEDIEHDYLDTIIEVGLEDTWANYNNDMLYIFAKKWCQDNNIEYE